MYIMKLSEAIRKGSEMSSPTSYDYYKYTNDGVATCAIGAAMLGMGRTPVSIEIGRVRYNPSTLHPLLSMIIREFPKELKPEGLNSSITVLSTIVILNDSRKMSREAIAMWVETLEDHLAEKAQKEHNISDETMDMIENSLENIYESVPVSVEELEQLI